MADRIEFLPTWVDEEVFVSFSEEARARQRRELARSFGLNPSRRWLLFVGRFEGQKDPLYLLELNQDWVPERIRVARKFLLSKKPGQQR